ncbi:terminase large subunit domain-containing protein [Arthrobacter woluwensis]|uniref:terminase large subunit domain-containing protein n=1 Tax=Arthrobacter woluwensis TaxID=156980 RepID=UPI001C939211|nr:terminase family protein [Arthrobacter woluwensis]
MTHRWPEIAPELDRMGIDMDTWQVGLSKAITAQREDGLYACGIGGAIISIPRQVGKTFTIGALIFALCQRDPGTLVLWTAHRTRTHNETFKAMESMAKRKRIAPFIRAIRKTNGEQEIEFTNGSRILFGAREAGFGRGFAQVDIIVLDEAQILTEKAMEDMVPATNAAANGLVILIGTPPRPIDPGEVFSGRRSAKLHDDDPDTLYVEFSADPHANPDDESQWAKANPSFPHRVKRAAILRMRKLLGNVESFLREGLGIWDERKTVKTAFSPGLWAKRKGVKPEGGRKVFGVKFSPDGATVALSGALRPDDPNAPIFVEGIKSLSASESTAWLVDFLVERKDEAAQIVIDGRSGVGFLVQALRQEKVPAKAILTPNTEEVIAAHSMFERAVIEGGLEHSGESELTTQAEAAIKRKIGNAGGFGWDSPAEGTSVALLDAGTLAYWGAKTTKRRPGRKGGFL